MALLGWIFLVQPNLWDSGEKHVPVLLYFSCSSVALLEASLFNSAGVFMACVYCVGFLSHNCVNM